MKTISLNNPNDVCFPFSKKWYDDPFVLYHGTSSIYSQNIEENGWLINKQPYEITDFQEICRIYEDIGWNGTDSNSGHSVLRSFTLGGDDDYVVMKSASFSQNYLTARNYSTNIGGESIHYFFLAIDDVINISNNSNLQEEHKTSIKKELDKLLELQKKSNNSDSLSYGINRYEKFLNNMTESFFDKSKIIASELLKKYEHIKKIHFPVVYVVKVEPTWFENHEQEFNSEIDKNLEIRAKITIPSSSIIARVDFPKDAQRITVFSNGPQPVPWEKVQWNENCEKHKINDFKI